MTLDNLPIIRDKALSRHRIRHKNEREYEQWLRGVEKYLMDKNPILNLYIENFAEDSQDPQSVRGVAYTLITLINDEMGKSGGLGK